MEDNKKQEEYDPYSLSEIFYEMELDLFNSLQRNFEKHKQEERKLGFSWEMWQAAKLRNLRKFRKQNENIIQKVKPRVQDAIHKVLTKYFKKGQDNIHKQIELENSSFSFPQDGKKTGRVDELPPKETNFFRMNEKKLNALIEVTKSDFDKAQYAVLRKMEDIYRQVIFKTEFQMSSGALSLGQSIDKATESFLEKGIDCIIYKNGARVNIVSYAEMALRTASHRAQLLGEGSKRDEYGNHLVFVTIHANACKLCLPWQGQILIDDVFSHPSDEYIAKYKEKYKLLSEGIKKGLLHPNCRHGVVTYFEGVTRLPKPVKNEIALKNYENEQKQRKLERAIRKQKRKVAGTVYEDNKKKERAKLRELQKQLRDFLEKHPEFKRQSRREKIEPIVKESIRTDNDDWLRKGYKNAIEKGDISSFVTFDIYKRVANEINKKLVGLTTKDGIIISGYKTHFIDRVVGQYESSNEPIKGLRKGVSIESVRNALLNGEFKERVEKSSKLKSVRYTTQECAVSVNPDTGTLIQTMPKK